MFDTPDVSPMRSTLALDVATRTGWAFATGPTIMLWPSTHMEAGQPIPRQTMKAVKSGSMKFGGETAVVVPEFRRWLTRKIAEHSPSLLAIEKPVPMRGAKINMATMIKLHAMYAAVLEVARIQGVELAPYNLGSVKKHWTGHGSASKADMVAEAVRRGLNPKNDDEADAQAILSLHAMIAHKYVVLRGEDA